MAREDELADELVELAPRLLLLSVLIVVAAEALGLFKLIMFMLFFVFIMVLNFFELAAALADRVVMVGVMVLFRISRLFEPLVGLVVFVVLVLLLAVPVVVVVVVLGLVLVST